MRLGRVFQVLVIEVLLYLAHARESIVYAIGMNLGDLLFACTLCLSGAIPKLSGIEDGGFMVAVLVVAITHCLSFRQRTSKPSVVESRCGIAATDNFRCSEVGASILAEGGHAVDAAIAATLCLGVISPSSSGIGGGGFMLVRDSKSQETIAVNMRETAPSAASRGMYAKDPMAKSIGPKSLGVPGELAGLRAAWEKHGRLPWRDLFQPAIKLAREGFEISRFTGYYLYQEREKIMKDRGLRELFVRDGKLLKAGEICYNAELANTLEAIAEHGPEALYGGHIGRKLVQEVQEAGGFLTIDDLTNYSAKVTEAVSTTAFGYEILGVPPPCSGALGVGLVLNILDGYGSKEALRGPSGLHRLAEAMKHMYAMRMNLGDPDFEDVDEAVSKMSSSFFADSIRCQKIDDCKTFKAEHYGARSSQLVDHGTSHLIVVDNDRNVVSMTSSLNDCLGGGMRSTSTGIILNNVMGDFSTPADQTRDSLPPAETNFIKPNKRPLSSMAPIIVLKENQFAGAIGGGGGFNIIPAVIQIFINHFVLGMGPLEAVQSPRIYHSIDPEAISYESWRVFNGEHYELSEEKKQSLINRGHKLKAGGGAICQFVVQSLDDFDSGILTAVSDPRKGGSPAGVSFYS